MNGRGVGICYLPVVFMEMNPILQFVDFFYSFLIIIIIRSVLIIGVWERRFWYV